MCSYSALYSALLFFNGSKVGPSEKASEFIRAGRIRMWMHFALMYLQTAQTFFFGGLPKLPSPLGFLPSRRLVAPTGIEFSQPSLAWSSIGME